jgi:hypothetical protein
VYRLISDHLYEMHYSSDLHGLDGDELAAAVGRQKKRAAIPPRQQARAAMSQLVMGWVGTVTSNLVN